MRCIWIILVLLLFSTTATATPEISTEVDHPFKYTNPYIDWPELRPSREALVEQLANGFVTVIEKESVRWYNCGEATPRQFWHRRAKYMASHVVAAMDFYGLEKVSPWGAMALVFKESRGNPCTPGPHPRSAAKKLGLIEPDKNLQQWSAEDAIRVLTDPKWGGRMADLGIGQNVWKRWSRVCDQEDCSHRNERIPTLEEMLSVEGSARVMVWGMRMRQKRYNSKWWRAPWLFWPGNYPNKAYARKLARIVSEMGGPYQEVLNWIE